MNNEDYDKYNFNTNGPAQICCCRGGWYDCEYFEGCKLADWIGQAQRVRTMLFMSKGGCQKETDILAEKEAKKLAKEKAKAEKISKK